MVSCCCGISDIVIVASYVVEIIISFHFIIWDVNSSSKIIWLWGHASTPSPQHPPSNPVPPLAPCLLWYEILVTALTILIKLSEEEESIILRILTEPFSERNFFGAPGVKTGMNFKQNCHCPIFSYIQFSYCWGKVELYIIGPPPDVASSFFVLLCPTKKVEKDKKRQKKTIKDDATSGGPIVFLII